MIKRHSAWWMRWFVVRAVRDPSPTGPGDPIGDDEYVECATLTRWGAERLIDGDPMLRSVSRRAWDER